MDEQRADEEKYFDFIDCVPEKDLENHKHEQKMKKIIVRAPKDTEMIADIH